MHFVKLFKHSKNFYTCKYMYSLLIKKYRHKISTCDNIYTVGLLVVLDFLQFTCELSHREIVLGVHT